MYKHAYMCVCECICICMYKCIGYLAKKISSEVLPHIPYPNNNCLQNACGMTRPPKYETH